MNLKEEDLVFCTVKKIEKTNVFVDIDPSGSGSIVMSEIAAGRIRNLREYISPNKKIVCKVLKIHNGNIELSLRRVTAKERESVLLKYQKEKNLKNMLKSIVSDPDKIIEEIKKSYEIPEFLEEAKSNPKVIEKFLSKKESEALEKILSEKKEKEKIVKRTISLSSSSPQGVKEIKEILSVKEAEIHYLGSSKFSISVSGLNFKEANQKLESILQKIEKEAKQKKAIIEIKEK